MSIARYLFNDWYTAHELDDMERRLEVDQRMGLRTSRRTHDLQTRVERLEQDLGRVALLARALAEACVAHGALPLEAVKREIERCDHFDGAADGRLDASYAHPEEVAMQELAPDELAPQALSMEEASVEELLPDLPAESPAPEEPR